MIYIGMTGYGLLNDHGNEMSTSEITAEQLLLNYHEINSRWYHISRAEKIIVLNFSKVPILKKDIKAFIKNARELGRLNKTRLKLMSTMQIFTLNDLGISVCSEYKHLIEDGFSLNNMNLSLLKEAINSEQVVASMEPDVPWLFIKILSELENAVVIWASNMYQPIERKESNPQAFLKALANFLQPFNLAWLQSRSLPKRPPRNFLECLVYDRSGREFSYYDETTRAPGMFYKDIKSILDGSVRRATIIGEDDFLVKYMLFELERRLGRFMKQNAQDAKNIIVSDHSRIFISNADELDTTSWNMVMSAANKENSENSIVVLQSKKPINNLRDANFKVIFLPLKEQFDSAIPDIIYFLIEQHFFDDDAFGYRWNLYLHSESVKNIFKMIPTFIDMENELIELKYRRNFNVVDFTDKIFWWEFKEYIDSKYGAPKQEINQEKSVCTEKQIKFIHRHNERTWTIYSEGFKDEIDSKFDREPYNKLLVIKYIAILIKYYSNLPGESTRSIEAKELYARARAWHKTRRNTSKKPAKKNIYNEIAAYLDQHSNRNTNKTVALFRGKLGKQIKDFFIIDDRCYCDNPKNDILLVVEDEDMPEF